MLASASASRPYSFPASSIGGGGALAGLVAGACIPSVLAGVSDFCFRRHVTATMTNILCGGGVGAFVGTCMHLSGLAQSLSLLTGAIRSLIRWRIVDLPEIGADGIPSFHWAILGILQYSQKRWSAAISHLPYVLRESPFFRAHDAQCTSRSLPVPAGLGFLHGCAFVYGSKVGWYHSALLPAILLEMDSAGAGEEASLLGAIDECALVMVCAGVCAGNLALPPPSGGERKGGFAGGKARGGGMSSLSWRALRTNVLCGDFIEAAYPSMERSRIVNGSAYVAAGLSTEILLRRRVLSTAYLPVFAAIWISNDRWGMGVACSVAFLVSFGGTIAANAIDIVKR